MEADRVLHRPTARRAGRTLSLPDPLRTLVRRKVLREVRRHGGKLRVQGSREHTRMRPNAHRPAMPPLVHIVRVGLFLQLALWAAGRSMPCRRYPPICNMDLTRGATRASGVAEVCR